MAAAYLLGFADIPSALRAYMVIGALLTATASISRASGSRSDFALLTASRRLSETGL